MCLASGSSSTLGGLDCGEGGLRERPAFAVRQRHAPAARADAGPEQRLGREDFPNAAGGSRRGCPVGLLGLHCGPHEEIEAA